MSSKIFIVAVIIVVTAAVAGAKQASTGLAVVAAVVGVGLALLFYRRLDAAHPERLSPPDRLNRARMLYDDGRIRCDETALVIRWYYLWGAKRIPYDSIRSVRDRPLTGWKGRWRIWGSGNLRHWYNLDTGRPKKSVALVLDTGHHVRPTITPDDAPAVRRILDDHINAS